MVDGNPLNAERIVRWILYSPGLNGGNPAHQYAANEVIACYSKGFCSSFYDSFYGRKLRLFDPQLDFFENLDLSANRSGTVTYVRKNSFFLPEKGLLHHRNIETRGCLLQANVGKRERLEMYAKAAYFVSYDMATFHNMEAALAGCTSVVIPMDGVTKREWEAAMDGPPYGVAYGVHDAAYAHRTQRRLKAQLQASVTEQVEHLRSFKVEVEAWMIRLQL